MVKQTKLQINQRKGLKFLLIVPVLLSSLLLLPIVNYSQADLKQRLAALNIQPLEGKAPNFSLSDLKGNNVSLANFKGKVVILYFWLIDWLEPQSRDDMRSLNKLSRHFKDKNLIILVINEGEQGKKRVNSFVKEENFIFTTLMDKGPFGEVGNLYGAKMLPSVTIIDKEGNLVGKCSGLRNWTSPKMLDLFNILTSKSKHQ